MELAAIPLMALLNRFRGGGFDAEILPGHPRFYVAPMVAFLASQLFGWVNGALFGACYLAWSFTPWGHVMCLGKFSPPRPLSWLEARALSAARGNFFIALTLVEFVGMLPLIIILSPIAVIAPVLFAACYELGWRLRPKAPIELAEILVGALWGVLMLVTLSGCAPTNDWAALSKGVGQQLEKSGR